MDTDEDVDDSYAWDDVDGGEDRCSECGAYPEEYHEMDCGYYGDEDDDIDAEDCASIYHPGCRACEVNGR